jgi:hypothetical protein
VVPVEPVVPVPVELVVPADPVAAVAPVPFEPVVPTLVVPSVPVAPLVPAAVPPEAAPALPDGFAFTNCSSAESSALYSLPPPWLPLPEDATPADRDPPW